MEVFAYLLNGYGCNEKVHNDKVAGASKHDKDMEDFMGTEVLVSGIKNRELQTVNNSADGVNDTSGQQPSETGSGE